MRLSVTRFSIVHDTLPQTSREFVLSTRILKQRLTLNDEQVGLNWPFVNVTIDR